ncbi:MAG TPA: FlgD immunoglobulin-like domain containing protein, partial [Candidatus Eisenbacteria bacterium]|nr:FlgD immunoglobulin-like domain containing protein [Candidatus Eisenbacteria bacterium]
MPAPERLRDPIRPRAPGHCGPWLALLLLPLSLPAPLPARAAPFSLTGPDSLTLRWTAPGDDGTYGTAKAYDIRISTSPLDSLTFALAVRVPNAPAPLPASSRQSMVVHGLTRGVPYWFALRTSDERGNTSPVSNVVKWTWPLDPSPPAAPAGLAANVQADGPAVQLTWQPNGAPNLAGYVVYRAVAAGGPWTRLNAAPVAATRYVDTGVPAGADPLYYEVSAVDAAGNEGPRSAALRVGLGSSGPPAPRAWGLEPAYPNPSHLGEAVRIPVEIPEGGGDARLELVDGAGQRVRRLAVGGAPGVREVVWDGRNDAGRACAPGVYRAWLIAG